MTEKGSMSLKAFLIHVATDPKLQYLLASLDSEQLVAYLVASGLSAEDAQLYAAAREGQAGKEAFAAALQQRQAEGWVMSAEGWVMSTEGWVMSAEGWVMSAEGWVMSAEGWVMSSEDEA